VRAHFHAGVKNLVVSIKNGDEFCATGIGAFCNGSYQRIIGDACRDGQVLALAQVDTDFDFEGVLEGV